MQKIIIRTMMKYIKLFETFHAEDGIVNRVVENSDTEVAASLKDAAELLKNYTVTIEGASKPLFTVNSCEKDGQPCLEVKLVPITARNSGLKPCIFGWWKFFINEAGTITSTYGDDQTSGEGVVTGPTVETGSSIEAAEHLMNKETLEADFLRAEIK